MDVVTPVEREWAEHVYHLYVVEVNDRDGVRDRLKGPGVATGVHYPLPLHLQPVFAPARGSLPVAEGLAKRIISLPMFPELTEEQIEHVCRALADAVQV